MHHRLSPFLLAALLIAFVAAASVSGQEAELIPDPAATATTTTLTGRWAIEYLPRGVNHVREHLLTEMTGHATAVKLNIRFVADDAAKADVMGMFLQSTTQLFPGVCRSSPDPEFWEEYGPLLLRATSVQVTGRNTGAQITLSLQRIAASERSISLTGGRAQDVTCGPIDSDRTGNGSPLTSGFLLSPASFTFRIEPVERPQLAMLRYPDFQSVGIISRQQQATVASNAESNRNSGGGGSGDSGSGSTNKDQLGMHQTRTDTNLFEIYGAGSGVSGDGLRFYIGAVGNKFLVESEEQRAALRRYVAYDGLRCWPAPCHLALRNRTHDIYSLREARQRAVRDFQLASSVEELERLTDKDLSFAADDKRRMAMERSWFDGSDSAASSVFRPENVEIVHSGLLLVRVNMFELAERGFDLVPFVDDVMENTKVPAQAGVYKLFARPPPPELTERPFERGSVLLHYPFMQLEAPYHPQQVLRITALERDRDEYNALLTPLVLTDRCLASGLAKDVDLPLRDVLPSYVHRCPGAEAGLLFHASMKQSLHPFSPKFFITFMLVRCAQSESDPRGCHRHLFREIPPGSSAWAAQRLKDIPGFDPATCVQKGADEDGTQKEEEEVEMELPPMIRSDYLQGLVRQMRRDSREAACSPRNDRRAAYEPATEPILPRAVRDGDWVDRIEEVSDGVLRALVRPLPGWRARGRVTLLSVELHPTMLRYPRHIMPSPFHMSVVVVPSPGVLRLAPVAAIGSADDLEHHPGVDGAVPLPAVETHAHSELPSDGALLSLDLAWTFDGFDSFSQRFVDIATGSSSSSSDDEHEARLASVVREQWIVGSRRNTAGRIGVPESVKCAAWQQRSPIRAKVARFDSIGKQNARVHLEFEAPAVVLEATSASHFAAVAADVQNGESASNVANALSSGDLWNAAGNCMLEVLPPPIVSVDWTVGRQRPLVQPFKLLYIQQRKRHDVAIAGATLPPRACADGECDPEEAAAAAAAAAAAPKLLIGPIRYTLGYVAPSTSQLHQQRAVAERFNEKQCRGAFLMAAASARDSWRGFSDDAVLQVDFSNPGGSNLLSADFEARPLLVSDAEKHKLRNGQAAGWTAFIVIDRVTVRLVSGTVTDPSGTVRFVVPPEVAVACGAPAAAAAINEAWASVTIPVQPAAKVVQAEVPTADL